MTRGLRRNCFTAWGQALLLSVFLLFSLHAFGGDPPKNLQMPTNWNVVTNFQVPLDQVRSMGDRLGATLSNVQNIIYNVDGKRIQINVILTPDPENAEKLMEKLKSMKTEEALLRKGLTVYEFVGQNDVLPMIVEGRKYLETK